MNARTATREAEPWIERLARLGYFSIGAVYIVAGALTAMAAFTPREGATDREEALAFILDKPFGKVVLLVMALGLAGYALWRIAGGLVDSDRRGNDAKGLGVRAAGIGSGLLYSLLMVEIFRLMTRSRAGGGGEESARHWTARLMDLPLGRWVAGAAGLAILAAGIYQLSRAWKANLSKRLRLASLPARARRVIVAVSRFGIAARGIVFGIIGLSLFNAARRYDPAQARGMSGAFAALTQQPFGRLLFATVAVGFVAYGVYAIVNGLYRQIDASPAR